MFFNPAQAQSQMNNPMFQQMMQQMQGGGMLQPPSQQQMPSAPQIPMAQAHPGAQQQGMTAPQAQGQQAAPGGMFGQMASGLGSIDTISSLLPSLIGNFGAEAAGPMLSGAAGYGTGTGLAGGASSLLSLLGFL